MRELYSKYREIIDYCIFGGLTTLVNFLVYAAAADALGFGTITATTVAWVLSVLFAYATNRKWVFRSTKKGIKNVLREGISFFAFRAGTYFMDLGIMWFMVDYLGFDELLQRYVIKLGATVLVVITNYIISKFIVFSRRTKT